MKEAGGKVKQGEKSHIVVFWKWLVKENKENREIEKIPHLQYYWVFEINLQVEGLESKRKEVSFEHDTIEKAKEIYKRYINCPDYTIYSGRAV
ncbi:ArdC-like ssDNA-binding domain-containing protein [Bacillus infantis]|uniref:ArdC-like ssDNA-binding domain-containing protein n=1 Tax=Bacillus infantis TaxID=324767 RepID=UPI003CEE755A